MSQTEPQDNSSELLRMTLPMMAQMGVPVTPENYAVWYNYVSGDNEPLIEEINRLKKAKETFNQERNDELYKKFISECDIAQFAKVRSDLSHIMSEINNSVKSADADASVFTSHLDDFVGQVEKSRSLDDIAGLMRELITETRQMRESTSALKNHFDNKTKQIVELQEELQRERKKSLVDPLTGIANRLALFDALDDAIKNIPGPHTVLMVDIDHFKRINDNYGHLVGDRVIRFIASILQKGIKGRDTAARYGGEEFTVVLPQTPLEGALIVAENIRKNIAEARLVRSDTKEPLGQVTVSIGASCYREDEDVTELLERADRALYVSKHNGRNKVSSEMDVGSVDIESEQKH